MNKNFTSIFPHFSLFVICFCAHLSAFSATWYVNDGATIGDVYCSAVGNNSAGTGSASQPYLTVSYVISNKVLGANDIVYIDAGNYNEGWALNSNADGGTNGSPLTFQGAGVGLTKNIYTSSQGIAIGNGSGSGNSYITFRDVYVETTQNVNTAYVNAGTSNIIFSSCSFKCVASGAAIVFMTASNCSVNSCTISTVYNGIDSYNSSNQIFDGNTITHASAYTAGQNHLGIIIEGTTSFPAPYLADNCRLSSNRISGFNYGFDIQQEGTGNTWVNNFVWACEYGLFCVNSTGSHATNTFKFNSIRSDKDCIYGACLSWTIQNNIFYSTARNCLNFPDNSNDPTTLNYNIYYAPSGYIANRNGSNYSTLAAWKAALSKDANSLSVDPLYTSATVLDITVGSPAIGAAGADGTVTDDVRRNPPYVRPTNNKDIGAFQYSNAVLPIELLFFNAARVSGGNSLYWSTASEINNDYFTVERSTDGVHFTNIAVVQGAGTSYAVLNYEILDADATAQMVYYRLKQTDADGSSSYSKIVLIAAQGTSDAVFSLYPNPCDGSAISLFFSLPVKRSACTVVLYDALGQLLFSQIVWLDKGVALPLQFEKQLARGIYFISVQMQQELYTLKFVVE